MGSIVVLPTFSQKQFMLQSYTNTLPSSDKCKQKLLILEIDYTPFHFHLLPLSVFGLSLRITPSINTVFGSCTLAYRTVHDSYQNKQYILYIILIYILCLQYI